MRIGANERVGIIHATGAEYAFGEILEIDLVDDADAGRHDFERVEGLHAPFQKLVTLAVAREFEFEILGKRVAAAGEIDLDRVVNDQIDGHQRLDDFWIFPELGHRRTHRREIDQQRHAREILQHDARNDEGDFLRALGLGRPGRERADGGLGDAFTVAIAQQRFQHQPDRDRQFLHVETGFFERGQRVERMALTIGGELL